jgi:hypothetical protein
MDLARGRGMESVVHHKIVYSVSAKCLSSGVGLSGTKKLLLKLRVGGLYAEVSKHSVY